MSSVDERVVRLALENGQFEAGAKQSMSTMEKLKQSMNFEGTSKGVEELERSLNSVSFNKIENDVDSLTNKFSIMGTFIRRIVENAADFTVGQFGKITQAIQTPLNLIKSGGWNRATNIENAKFQIKGMLKATEDFDAAWKLLYDDMDYAVAGTAYGLDSAAKAASQLMASGITAGEGMKAALRGISGVAAMTNSTYDEIANIFTTVASNGRLMGDQLRQFSAKGLSVTAELGKQMGKTESEIRKMVSKGQVDFATFSKAMDDAFGQHAKDANETYAGSLANVRAALSKIGAITAEVRIKSMVEVFNNLRQAINAVKTAITPLLEVYNVFQKSAIHGLAQILGSVWELNEKNNAVLKDALKFGDFLSGLLNLFLEAGMLLDPVIKAFKTVFDLPGIETIGDLNTKFKEFTETLIPSQRLLNALQISFTGLFKVIKSVGTIALRLGKTLFNTLSPIINLAGNLFIITNELIDLLLQSAPIQSILEKIESAIKGVGEALDVVVVVLAYALSSLGTLLSKINFTFLTNALDAIASKVKALVSNIPVLNGFITRIVQTFSEGFLNGILTIIVTIVETIENFLSTVSNSTFFQVLCEDIEKALNRILNVGQSIIDTVTPFFGRVVDFVSELSLDKVLDTLLEIYQTVKNIASTIGTGIASKAGSLFDLLTGKTKLSTKTGSDMKENISPVMELMDSVSKSSVASSGGFSKAFENMKNAIIGFIEEPDWNMFRSVVHTVLSITTWVVVIDVLNSLGGAIRKFGNVAGSISAVINKMFGVSTMTRASTVTNMFKAITQSVVAIAASLVVLSFIEKDKLIKASVALGALVTVVGTLAIVIAFLDRNVSHFETFDKDLKVFRKGGIASSISALALSMVGIASALKIISEIKIDDLKDFQKTIIAFAEMMGVFTIAVIAINTVGSRMKISGIATILTLAYSMDKIAASFQSFTKYSWDEIKAGVVGFAGVCLAIGSVGALVGNAGLGGALVMYVMATSMEKFLPILETLKSFNYSEIIKSLELNKQTMLELGAVIALCVAFPAMMGKGLKAFSGGLLMFVGSIALMALLAKKLNGLNKADFDRGLEIIQKLSMIALGVIFVAGLSKGAPIGRLSAFLVSATACIGLMALMTTQIGNVKRNTLKKGVAVMAGLTALIDSMIIVGAIASKGQAKIGAVIAAVSGLATLVMEVIALSYYPEEQIMQGLKEMGWLVAMLDSVFISVGLMKVNSSTAVSLLAAMGVITTFAGALYALSALKVNTKTILAFSAGLVAIIYSFSKLNGIELPKIKPFKTFMDLISVLLPIVGSIALLSKFGGSMQSVLTATVAISAVLFSLAGVFAIMSTLHKQAKTIQGYAVALIEAASAVAIVAVSLTVLATQDWTSILAACAGISAAMLSLGGVLTIMSALGKKKDMLTDAGALLLASLSILPIAYALMKLAAFPWENILSAAVSISATMVGIGVLLNVIAPLKGKAIAAAAILDVVTGVVGGGMILLAYALGQLHSKYPNMESDLEFMGNIFRLIGKVFGEVIGGFVEGIADGILHILPDLATALSDFMVNLIPFVAVSEQFKSFDLVSFASVIAAIMLLGGAELVGAITEFIASPLPKVDLADKLKNFGNALNSFYESISDLDGDAVTKIKMAAEASSALAVIPVPREGGFIEKIVGSNNIDQWGERLSAYGSSLMAFYDSVKSLSDDSIVKLKTVADLSNILTEITPPNEGGALAKFLGDNLLDVFGARLELYGVSLVRFGEVISLLPKDIIANTDIVKAVSDQMTEITPPNEGGLWALLVGDNDLSTWGQHLESYALSLVRFGEVIMAIPKTIMSDIGLVKDVSLALSEMGEIAIGDTSSWNAFYINLEYILEGISTFVTNISAVDFSNMTTLRAQITTVREFLDEMVEMASMDLSSLGTLKQQLEEAGDLGLQAFIDGFTGVNQDVNISDAIAQIMMQIGNAIKDDIYIKTEIGFKLQEIESQIRDYYKNFYDDGGYLVQGFAAGITDSSDIAITAAQNLGAATEQAIRDQLSIHSPSVIFEEIGSWIPKSLAIGMDDDTASKAGQKMGADIEESIRNQLDIHSKSPIFELIGKWIPWSTGSGIEDATEDAVAKAKESANKTVDAYQETIRNRLTNVAGTISKMSGGKIDISKIASAIPKDSIIYKLLGGSYLGNDPNQNETDDLPKKLDETTKKVNDLGNSAAKSGKKASKAAKDSAKDLQMLAKYTKYAKEVADLFEGSMNKLSDTLLGGKTRTQVATAAIDALAERLYKAKLEADGTMEDTTKKAEERAKEVKETFVNLVDSITKTIKGGFKIFEQWDNNVSKIMKPEKALKAARSQVAGLASLPAYWNQLASRGINFNWLKELIEKGAEALPEMRMLLQSNADEFKEMNEIYANEQKMASETAIKAVNSLAIAMSQESLRVMAETGDEFAKASLKWFDAIAEVNGAVDKMHQNMSMVGDAVKSALESATNYFEDFGTKTKVTADQALKNIQSQIDARLHWRDWLKQIADKGGSAELVSELAKMGLEGGYGLVQGIAEGTEAQIATLNQKYAQILTYPEEISDQVSQSYWDAGVVAMNQLMSGLNSAISEDPAVLETLQKLPETFLVGLAEQLQNGELDFSQVGEALMAGIGTSIEDTSDETAETGRKAGKKTADAVEDGGVSHKKGSELGEYLGQGVADGIRAMIGEVQAAAAELAAAAIAAFEAVPKIASPSKVMIQDGKYIDMGLIIGIQSMESQVADASSNLGRNVVDSIQSAIVAANEIVDDSTDMNPVITPVIDLSEVQSGSALLSTMMSDRSLNIAGNMDANNLNIGGGFDIASMLRSAVSEGLSGFTGGQTVHNDFNIVVNAAPGQDPTEIAEAVRDQLTGEVSRKVSAFA